MPDNKIADALNYERLTVAKRSEELLRQTERDSLEWRSRFVQHGHTGWSSPMVAKLLELQLERLRALVQYACQTRRELCNKFPKMCAPEMLLDLQNELHGRISAEQNHIPHAVAGLVGGPSEEPKVSQMLNSSFETSLLLLRGDMERELKRIEHESNLGMLAPEQPASITVNIGSMV